MKHLVTATAAARLLGLTVGYVHNLRQQGALVPVATRLRRREVMFRRSDVRHLRDRRARKVPCVCGCGQPIGPRASKYATQRCRRRVDRRERYRRTGR